MSDNAKTWREGGCSNGSGRQAHDEVHEVSLPVRCFSQIDEHYDGLATSTGSPSLSLSLQNTSKTNLFILY